MVKNIHKKAMAFGWLLLMCAMLVQGVAAQPPPLPATFYGTVALDSLDAPEGTPVRALIDGVTMAETAVFLFEGRSVYVLDVPGDDLDTPQVEGGTDGVGVYFAIGDMAAEQTATWQKSISMELNLTATPAACTTSLAGDVNCDCRVDVADLMLATDRLGTRSGDPGYDVRYDLNQSGNIDVEDIALAAAHWRDGC